VSNQFRVIKGDREGRGFWAREKGDERCSEGVWVQGVRDRGISLERSIGHHSIFEGREQISE
jgi:hypothetical protein